MTPEQIEGTEWIGTASRWQRFKNYVHELWWTFTKAQLVLCKGRENAQYFCIPANVPTHKAIKQAYWGSINNRILIFHGGGIFLMWLKFRKEIKREEMYFITVQDAYFMADIHGELMEVNK